MKKVWLGILATLLLALFVAPAFAWEFSMTGEFEWRQQYFSRTGNRDLFGDANAQDTATLTSDYGLAGVPVPTTINPGSIGFASNNNYPYVSPQAWVGFAGPNYYLTGWINPTTAVPSAYAPAGAYGGRPIIADAASGAGVAITRGGFSRWGSDAWLGDQRLTFVPSFRVNNAIRVHGTYTVGGLRQKYAQRTYDAYGQVSPGTPPFERYYTHHSSEAAYNTAAIGSWEQIRATVQLPIGTLSYGVKDFPFGTGIQYANNTRTDSILMVVPYGPFRLLFGLWPGQGGVTGLTSFDTVPDRDTKWDYRYGAGFTYDNGPLSVGFLAIPTGKHIHPRYSYAVGTIANGAGGADYINRFWQIWAKYNNGRFFANAEFVTAQSELTRNRGIPQSWETTKYFAEIGALCGPAKTTLMAGWASGQVLNYDTVAGTAHSGNQTKYGKGSITTINYQALQPYSFLMFPTYAGGNNQFNADGTGEMGDAYCLAARLDYAAAANLNLFGSYIWASRVEQNGYIAGTFFATSVNTQATGYASANGGSTYNAATAAAGQQWKADNTGNAPANLNPYVDDSYIGWEAQAGLDWKMLEGFSMNMTYSYWQPGPWFDQAYQVFTNTQYGRTGNGLMVGRDAIQAIRGAMVINF